MKKELKPNTVFLHILPANVGRTYRFIKFIKENFDANEHRFLIDCSYITAVKNHTRLLEFSDLMYVNYDPVSPEWKTFILNIFKQSKYVIWHSLTFTKINPVAVYTLKKSFFQKSSWVENGFDILSNNLDLKQKNIETIIRGNMQTIGSIGSVNSDLILNTYGRYSLNICYPPDPMFYELPNLDINPFPVQKGFKVIQLGTDTRVFSHTDDIISFFKTQQNKFKENKYCFIMPNNLSLYNDNISVKLSPSLINNALQAMPTLMIKNVLLNKEEYINYYKHVKNIVISPSAILYPEYLFAPVFCGCSIYLINKKDYRKLFPDFSFFGSIGKLDKKIICNTLNNIKELKNTSSPLTVFFPNLIKLQWERFFDAITKEGEE